MALIVIFSYVAYGKAPTYNPLSLKWAEYIRKYPGRKKTKQQQAKHIKLFKAWHKEAYRLYKIKQDTIAIKKYASGLKHYATGKAYYDYGNSLSNTTRLNDSIKAYKIAIALKFKKLHFANFNIACVYSRLKDRKNSIKYLKIAVKKGYTHLGYIKSDSDLSYLRSGPAWKKQLKEIGKIRYRVIYGASTFRQVRWGMIPWNILKIEKTQPVREGVYQGFYMLWFKEKFLNKPVLLKYLFDKRWYRLQYGAYSFIHIVKDKKNSWTGFDFRTKKDSVIIKDVRRWYEKVYKLLSGKLRKKFGKPQEEDKLTQQGNTIIRFTRWRSKKYFITLKCYITADGIMDISVYFSNRKKNIKQLL